jgi:hypothetical protein
MHLQQQQQKQRHEHMSASSHVRCSNNVHSWQESERQGRSDNQQATEQLIMLSGMISEPGITGRGAGGAGVVCRSSQAWSTSSRYTGHLPKGAVLVLYTYCCRTPCRLHDIDSR